MLLINGKIGAIQHIMVEDPGFASINNVPEWRPKSYFDAPS